MTDTAATAKDLEAAIKAFRKAADGDSGDAEYDAAVTLADEAASYLKATQEPARVGYVFTGDELATILHGLRIVQELRKLGTGHVNGSGCAAWEQASPVQQGKPGFSCDHFDTWMQLEDAEIDALCERINPFDASNKKPDSAIVGVLRDTFPWLGTGEEVDGADVVDALVTLYDELTTP